ncbi:MAG: TonB-dependent receptor [Steroidobacter sp.]
MSKLPIKMPVKIITVTLSVLCTTALAAEAIGQQLDEIEVTGTRHTEGRATLASPVPIDVIDGERLDDSGYADVSRGLQFALPSVNFNRAATTATAASTRPLTLRGLAPDQVLVLINGKRRHSSSILNTNNSVGRGSAPVDFNMIPEAAIQRIEVLRDGAAAQYGSDAIAGVINIILRDDAEGVFSAAQAGATAQGDGENQMFTVRTGLKLGEQGHLTLTGEFRHQEPTNRANVDQRFNRVTYKIGDPRITDINLALDSSVAFGSGELYFFGTGSHRNAQSPSGFRVPGYSPLYPSGYVALINPTLEDFGVTGGFRTTFDDGLHFDFSHTVGYDHASFEVTNTANQSLGASSPSRFDAGAVTYRQHTTDVLVTKDFDAMVPGLYAAAGLQHRAEYYHIHSGEPLAYFGAGADGFPGFNPRNPVDKTRSAYAVFVDAELNANRMLTLGLAGRYDHYSDFGDATTWKGTARLALTSMIALRGAASTGFRAPSMQQQYFDAVTNNLTSKGALVTVGTLPVSDPVARALGASDLKPEKSRNLSAGIVLSAQHISFTADWYRIKIDDRIALSEQLGGAAVTSVLAAAGITNVQQVRFFTNAVDTETEGFEVAARYAVEFGNNTNLNVGAGYGRFNTDLKRLAQNPVLPTLPLLGNKSILFITKAQPKDKITLDTTLGHGPFTLKVNVTRFGECTSADLITTQTYTPKTIVDLSLGAALGHHLSITGGVQNLGDVYPDQPVDNALPSIIAATGGSFPDGEAAPFGFNGRAYFLRLEARF